MSVCAQFCLTFWDSMDYRPTGFSVHGLFLARILERVTISYSRGISWTQGLKLHLPALAGGFFTTELPGSPGTRGFQNLQHNINDLGIKHISQVELKTVRFYKRKQFPINPERPKSLASKHYVELREEGEE